MSTGKSVVVPGEVAIAVMTSRVEMLAPLRARIEKGDVLGKEEMLGMVDLVKRSLEWRDENAKRDAILEGKLNDLHGHLIGFQTKTRQLLDVLNNSGHVRDDE